MSSTDTIVQIATGAGLRAARFRAVVALLLAVALETAITIGHFVYGARLYDDPSREHVVLPAIVLLAAALALGGLYHWRPTRLNRALLAAEIAVAYLLLFGTYHGAFGHGIKDLLFFGGMSGDELARLFDSPDFVVPDDVFFEASGLATFLAALIVAFFLKRLFQVQEHRNGSASPSP